MHPLLPFLLILSGCTAQFVKPQAPKLQHNGIYRLEIQSEDKFLTGIPSKLPQRTRWQNLPEQKWRFEKVQDSKGEEAWKISPLNEIGGGPFAKIVWKTTYVGHGKFQFRSVQTGLCLSGARGQLQVTESAKCLRESPYQRWLVQQAKP